MKIHKKIINVFAILLMVISCTEDNSLDFLETFQPPSNIAAAYNVTQDNTGLVTITPTADGATSFDVHFGDEAGTSENIPLGKSVSHTYSEGTYDIKIVAYNVKGDTAEATQPLTVSFKAPEGLVVSISNDAVTSKKVNITATADYATMYEFYSGETDVNQPVASGNIGEEISYTYATPGTYDVRVVAKGAAIETTEYTEAFDVTEILAPITKAPIPPTRNAVDVISIFSDKYTQTTVDSFTTDWSVVALQEEVTIDADQTLVYRDLSYAGIITETAPINAASMEMVHFDIWTSNVSTFKIKFVDFNGTGYNGGADNIEFEIENTISQQGSWVSFNIPLTEFTGVPFSDINQTVVSADPVGTIFIDNLYFYRASTVASNDVTPIDFEVEYTLDQFDGGGTEVVANPDINGNDSANVLKLVKGAGQPWAGSKITIPEPFSFASSTTITAKIWSPRVGLNILAKFEDAVPWPDVTGTAEITATTTTANQWEEISFDFAGIDTSIDWYNLVLIMDNGTQGDATANYTIYLDDFSTSPALDFEPGFTLDQFDGGGTEVIANPDTNGNSSASVLQLVKGAGQPWAGSKITVPSPFNFDNGTTLSVKVWSPRVGLNLLAKFEDAVPWPDVTGTDEITFTSTVANQWEEFTFDFAGIDTSIDWFNLVFIMDNGTQGDATANYTIYVDDITLK